jgi:hypothetical protein
LSTARAILTRSSPAKNSPFSRSFILYPTTAVEAGDVLPDFLALGDEAPRFAPAGLSSSTS